MTRQEDIAQAFSGHRFPEAYPHLADDVRWTLVGADTIEGRARVIELCDETTQELIGATTEFTRFLVVAGSDAVAIDTVSRYVAADGQTSVVSSCDLYEFDGDLVTAITSYTVELAP